MISRTHRLAFAGLALALTMAACASSDADDAATTSALAGDATVATTPSDTEPGSDTTSAPTEPATSEPATGTDTTAPAEPEPVTVPEALQFTAPLVGGGEFDGAAVAGTPTLFWFWAPT